MFNNQWAKSLTQKFSQVQASDIADNELKNKFAKLRAKQAGFTLLELLVVVAILAAIAGTASIALKDTDARASAAAHVTMMDELNKGIRTYRVLNKNAYPDRFDSLMETATVSTAATRPAGDLIAIEDVRSLALDVNTLGVLNDIGITQLQYLDTTAGAHDLNGDSVATDCDSANIQATIASRSNAVVSNNIFQSPAANGCGVTEPLIVGSLVQVWNGGYERVFGGDGAAFDVGAAPHNDTTDAPGAVIDTTVAGQPILMAVGLGPSSNLFNANSIGGMTTVPSYRHVNELQYGRFIALFEIGEFTDVSAAVKAVDQVNLIAIVDGAGDTKEEELGEWDGTRNTI
jgi:prepilin-type N-terminal cleavage/methylation domain-containing protein